MINSGKKYMQEHWFLLLMTFGYICTFSFLTIYRYTHYLTGYYDLGVFINPLYNTTHGHFLMEYNVAQEMNLLGAHQSYIVIPLAYIYAFFQNAQFLLILQTLLLASGTFPLYFLARDILKSKIGACSIAFAYLFTATFEWTNTYDFHPEIFGTTFLLCGWYFLVKKRWILAVTFLLLTVSSKEDAGFVVGMLGIAAVIHLKLRWQGILIAILGISLSIIEIAFLIPHFNGTHTSLFIDRYAELGHGYTEIIKNIFFNPPLLIHSLFYPQEKIIYLVKVFSQTAFLSFFSPFILVAIPSLGINLLGSSTMYEVTWQYTYLINAVLLISTIYGIRNIQNSIQKKWHVSYERSLFSLLALLILFSIGTNLLFGPVLNRKNFQAEFRTSKQRVSILNQMVALVPQNVSVDASDFIAPEVSNRTIIKIFPASCDADYLLFEPTFANGGSNLQYCKEVIAAHYRYIYRNGDFFVAKRK